MNDHLINNLQVQRRQLRQDESRLKKELSHVRQENLALKEEIESLKEAMENTPSAVLKTLVEKLKRDLAEKEKKVKAMGKAIGDLKQELMAQAGDVDGEQDKMKASRSSRVGRPSSRGPEGTDETAVLKRRIDDLVQRNNKLQKQVSVQCTYVGARWEYWKAFSHSQFLFFFPFSRSLFLLSLCTPRYSFLLHLQYT